MHPTKNIPTLHTLHSVRNPSPPQALPSSPTLTLDGPPCLPPPTPIQHWADSVPSPLQTPTYGGQGEGSRFEEEPPKVVDPTPPPPPSLPFPVDHQHLKPHLATAQFTPPPPPVGPLPSQTPQAHYASTVRWFAHVAAWVDEAYTTCGVALPLPPPPPQGPSTALWPYTYPQWKLRVDRWYSYVVRQWYHNDTFPTDGLLLLLGRGDLTNKT